MPDTKITALTAIGANPIIPSTFPIPMVDLTDTSMAASGTTKKVTVNQILGAGGTATLASATISGDLTVDTSTLKVDSALNKVGVGVATLTGLQTFNVAGDVGITSDLVLKNSGGTVQGYIFGSSGINYRVIAGQPHVWQEGGSDLMRLNSTGLGVGVSPSYKLTVQGSDNSVIAQFGGTNRQVRFVTAANGGFDNANFIVRHDSSVGGFLWQNNNGSNTLLTIDSSGNLGIGVTPSATWASNRRALQVGGLASGAVALNGTAGSGEIFFNSFFNTSSQNICVVTGGTGKYDFNVSTVGAHSWSVGTGTAGNAFTFTQAMTLESTGSLVLGAAAVATTATDGFLYIPGCAGTPTGTPTAKTGRVPLVVDTTNNKLYFYSGGAWVAAN